MQVAGSTATRVEPHVPASLSATAAIRMDRVLVVLTDDRHRRLIRIDHQQTAASQGDPGHVAGANAWADRGIVRTQYRILAGKAVWRGAVCEIDGRCRRVDVRVGRVVRINALEQLPILIR